MQTDQSILAQLRLTPTSLAGSVAVVTGAGRGIGRAVATLLASLGARVAIAELDEQAGRDIEREIQAAGGAALFVRTDVASADDVMHLAAKVAETYGGADILVNNAILCPVCSVLDTDPALWDRVMAVNLRGALLTCKAFLPSMLERGHGTIINMVSADAMAFMSAYIASKQALAAFSQSLSSEVAGHGIRVVAFAPGFVDTPGLREAGRQLGPKTGMSEQQFLGLSLHPAYPGMMPVSDAAYATAYLVAHLADEYAGEVVTGYRILERAGYITAATDAPAENVNSLPIGATATPQTSPAGGRAETLALAVSSLNELKQALADTEAEFNRLPLFVRPLARNGFKGKAGQSLAEWMHTLGVLGKQLADQSAAPTVAANLPQLSSLVEKLVSYYQGVPAETARFTKDPAFIEATRLTCDRRIEVARTLVTAIERLVGL